MTQPHDTARTAPRSGPRSGPRITLNDGHTIPQIGLGVWQMSEAEAPDLVQTALQTGYRHIDTAARYDNETGIGRGLAQAIDARDVTREDVFVTTKVWNTEHGRDLTLRAFDASMERLGLERIDLYLVHWPCPSKGLYVETWKTLLELQASGRITSVGVSNFGADHLERIIGETGVVPVLNQVELHPRFQQRALREAHARHGIATECWSPLGRGALLEDAVLTRIAAKHGCAPAQVILAWHLSEGLIAIPKSAHPGRMAQNLAAAQITLEPEDLAAIAGLDAADGRIGPDPSQFEG